MKYIKKYLPDHTLHKLTYYDLTLITEGEGYFRMDDICYQTKAADILFSLPSQLREWDTQHLVNGYTLIFEEEFLLSFFNDPHFIDNISYFSRSRETGKLSLSPAEFEHIRMLMLQMKHHIPRNSDNHSRIYQFLQLVSSDFPKNHAVQYYAEKLHLTPNYLNELIKRATGLSAKQVIQNKLMTESKKYLLYSSYTITEIAERLSFETPSYFIRFFRKHTGYTPLQFRKNEKP